MDVGSISNRKLAWLGTLGLIACAVAAAIALANLGAPDRGASAAIAALTVGSLVGVGLYAWRHGPERRSGRLLLVAGFCWFLASLSNSDVDSLYSIGRVSAWVFEVVLIYALLAYPNGRLSGRTARLTVGFAALLVLTLYIPTVPLVSQFPIPSPFTTCTSHCPANWFFVAESQPAAIDSFVRPLREVLTVVMYLAVAALLAARLRTAGRNLRRTLAPVLGAAILRFGVAVLYVALRQGGVNNDVLEVFTLLALLTIPITALGFFVGLLKWRIFSGSVLTRLTTDLPDAAGPQDLRSIVAEALGDPSVELFYSVPGEDGRWRDLAGEVAGLPVAGTSRCVVEVTGEAGPGVALACEEGFRDHPGFVRAVGFYVLSALERRRLTVALDASLHDVEASRKRLAAAADTARQKIEQDLHDGAQQQLVTLRVKLELARETLEQDPSSGAEQLAELGPEVEEIIEEVRSLARGIYPPLLASGGLNEALRAAGQRAPLPVSVDTDGVGRYPAETESAVYFCCLEALQNASKHADGATGVWIRLCQEGGLRFEVSDDGCGFSADADGAGSGVTGMHDRLAAVGGELRIESAPNGGTRVLGRLPLG